MNEARVSIPADIAEKLRPLAEQMGLSIPGMARYAPTIDVTQPIGALALEVGRHAAMHNMYLKSGAVITVDTSTGETTAMTARAFPAWLEVTCGVSFKAPGARQKRDSLVVEDGAQILETEIFRSCLRPLEAVHTMRLPVARAGELFSVDFLEAGYDKESKILTLDLVPYPMDWPLERGCEWLIAACWEFPWNGMESVVGKEARMKALRENRSFAVHVSALLGSYCRGLFPAGTTRPMLAYLANKPGSGKTRLAEMALAHIYGLVGSTTSPKDEDKMDVKLETVARALQPFVIYDNVGRALKSPALEKFITEARHTGRCYNSNSEFFDVPNVTQVFVTANELPTSEDLSRRALVAEFFLAEEVRGRTFERFITATWLAEMETRKKFLASCCAVVKHWIANFDEKTDSIWGRPMPRHPRPLESFETWTGIIGGMVTLAELADPLQPAEKDVGGASAEDEMRTLLMRMAEKILAAPDLQIAKEGSDYMVTRKDLVALARSNGLIEHIVGAEGDGELDEQKNARFGRQIQRWRGQRLQLPSGKKFQFGHKRKKAGAIYPLTFI